MPLASLIAGALFLSEKSPSSYQEPLPGPLATSDHSLTAYRSVIDPIVSIIKRHGNPCKDRYQEKIMIDLVKIFGETKRTGQRDYRWITNGIVIDLRGGNTTMEGNQELPQDFDFELYPLSTLGSKSNSSAENPIQFTFFDFAQVYKFGEKPPFSKMNEWTTEGFAIGGPARGGYKPKAPSMESNYTIWARASSDWLLDAIHGQQYNKSKEQQVILSPLVAAYGDLAASYIWTPKIEQRFIDGKIKEVDSGKITGIDVQKSVRAVREQHPRGIWIGTIPNVSIWSDQYSLSAKIPLP